MVVSHEPKVVEWKQVSNEQVAYRIVCCEDPAESSWHTIHVAHPDHEDWLEDRKAEVAKRHEAMEKWREKWQPSPKS